MTNDKFKNLEPKNNMQEKHEKIQVEYAAETIASERRPNQNQDTILTNKEYRVFGVFDGVGGGPAGDFASRTARDFILDHLKEISDKADIDMAKQTLLEIVVKTDEAVYEASKTNDEYENMSTTAAIVKIHTDAEGKNNALVANVGDSRVYKISKDGTLQQITLDDNIVGNHISDINERSKI
jgi:protein phosphatase